MNYIMANEGKFNRILININIDGAGYKTGKSAFSFFDLPEDLQKKAEEVLKDFPGIVEGIQWPQGDHSIFLQHGRPAIAVSSKWFIDNIDSQTITHTPEDNIDLVDCHKIVELAEAITSFIQKI